MSDEWWVRWACFLTPLTRRPPSVLPKNCSWMTLNRFGKSLVCTSGSSCWVIFPFPAIWRPRRSLTTSVSVCVLTALSDVYRHRQRRGSSFCTSHHENRAGRLHLHEIWHHWKTQLCLTAGRYTGLCVCLRFLWDSLSPKNPLTHPRLELECRQDVLIWCDWLRIFFAKAASAVTLWASFLQFPLM